MELLILLAGLGAIAYLYLNHQNQKLQQIRTSDVVSVDGADVRYPGLAFGEFGIPRQFKSPDRVQVIFPKLTVNGDVEYIYSWHRLSAVQPIDLIPQRRQTKLRLLMELSPIVKDHLKLETDRAALEAQYSRLDKLARLVASSDVYRQQIETYDRAIEQTENLFRKIDELEDLYVRRVRESLIGLKISEYDPDALLNMQSPLNEQFNRLRDEYQLMKDTAQAYFELLKESQSWKSY